MLDSKTVRSPAGQKLIKDLMLGDDDLEVAVVDDDLADADKATTPGSRQRSQGRGALPLRPSNGVQRRGSLPVGRSAIGSAKTQHSVSADSDLMTADRPATAPASSNMLLVPPQLPAARGPKDAKYSPVSPLLERHLVSRHTSAYLGVVTAVLHQVSSPAATGAPRDTQRRPGTVPRDVYQHSAIAPPKRHNLSSTVASDSIPFTPDGTYSSTTAACGVGFSRIAAPGSPTNPMRFVANGESDFQDSSDVVGSSFYSPYGQDGAVMGSLYSRGGSGSSGERYVPYLDRSYGSHAPLACTVDALARRAEAHKALTRQRLLQKQLEQQVPLGGMRRAQKARQSQLSSQQHEQSSQQQQKRTQIVLAQPGANEPYQLRMEGGVHPVALGLAWDTSPGVVAAAAAVAATTAAAIAARAEGLSASASPFLRDPAASPSLRDFVVSPRSRGSPGSGGNAAPAVGASSSSPQRRRNRGGGTPEWSRPPTGLTGSGRSSPTGAPGSPPKVRLPRTPQSAAEAAAMAAEAEEVVRSHLPPAVRRGYNGQLAAQTIKDWETIAEPNRRMMQEIENATKLVRGSPPRRCAALASHNSDGRSGRHASTTPTTPGSASSKRYAEGQEVGARAGGASGATAGGEPIAAAAAAAAATAAAEANSSHDSVPFGKHTSARSRRRYIRYSLDVFPELGLPPRSTSDSRATGAANGPFGTAGATAAAVAAPPAGAMASGAPMAMAPPGPSGGWGPWEMSTAASSGLFGLDTEVSAAQMDAYNQPDYGESEYGAQYGAAAKGPRYVLAAAARVPVPIHLHPLPTPSAAIAAVVAGGGAAGAAAATLPQWMDPLAAAVSGTVAASGSIQEMESTPPGLQSPVSVASSMLLPAVGSASQSSLHGTRGTTSRTTSVPLEPLSARGVGLQGYPSGPPLGSQSTSVGLDDLSGSWSGAGSGVTIVSRNTSVTRRHALQQSSKQQAAGASGGGSDEAIYHEPSAGSSGTALRSVESQSASPQSTPRGEGDDSPVRGVSTSVSSITVGRGSPSLEPSLLPLAHTSVTSILHSEKSPDLLEPQADRTAGVTGTASLLTSGLTAKGPIHGRDLDLDLGLGPAGDRTDGSHRRDLDLFSIAADSRLSTPGSHLPASAGGQGEGEGYDMSPGEEEAAAEGTGQDLGVREEERGVWGFREHGFASAGPSGHHELAAAAAAGAPTGPGANGPEWDAGPTPRLIGQSDGSSKAGVQLSTKPPFSYRRTSSAASDTAGSASLGSSTPHNDHASAGSPVAETSTTRVTAPLLGGEGAAAAPAWSRGSRDVIDRSHGGVTAGLGAADERSIPVKGAVQDMANMEDGDGTASFASGEDFTRDMSPVRAAAAAAIPQGPVLTHGTGYRVVTSVAASLVSEDPREAARLAAQRDLEAQLERSSEHTAKLKAASRATKALARAGSQHSSLLPTALPAISTVQPSSSGYSIVQPRASRMGLLLVEEPQGAGLSVLDAPVPAPAEMEAMASAARAALSPAQPAMMSRLGQSVASGTPQRRFHPHLQSERDRHGTGTPVGPGAYMHIQATIEPGRTAQMQDLWAS